MNNDANADEKAVGDKELRQDSWRLFKATVAAARALVVGDGFEEMDTAKVRPEASVT